MSGHDNLRLALHPKLLELIIFPTEKCNFRCTYCYEEFKIGKMKRPVIQGIKNLIDARIERKTLDVLNLSWFGGEPTLASDVMMEISEHATRHLNAGRLKQLSGGVTTNGYKLNSSLLNQLVSVNQRHYQISLDGYKDGHDKTRRYASGKGTFDVIWENLVSAHRSSLNFEIVLRLHQTEENGASVEQLVEEICRTFAGDRRFSVFFKAVENLGGPNAAKIKKVNVESVTQRVDRLNKMLGEHGFVTSAVLSGPESQRTPGVGTVAASPNNVGGVAEVGSSARKSFEGYICYASKPNSLAIRSDGRIAKCTVMLEDDRNTVGKLNPDGTVEIDADKLKPWMRGFKTFDAGELGCPAQNLPAKQTQPQEIALVRLEKVA